MKISKKFLGIFSGLVLFLTLSCSNNTDERTVKFWAMGAEAEYLTKLVPEFEKLNPGIKIKVQQIPWTAAQEKLVTAFASDNTPDACQLGNTWIPQFAALNAIIPLDEYIKQSDQLSQEKYFPGIWETNVIDKKVFGIPWYVDTRVMFYRKDVFEKAGFKDTPKNWNELLDLSKRIKSFYPKEENYAIYLPTNEFAPFIMFGMQAGSSILKDNDTRGNFSGKEFEAWQDSLLKNDPFIQAFYLQFMNVRATPKIPEWEQIAFSKVQQYAEYAARGVMSVDEALKNLDNDVDRILEKRRWLVRQKHLN